MTAADDAEAAGDLLVATGCTKRFGGLVAVSDVDFTIPRGGDRQPHRTERRRQDDVLQHDHRPVRPDRRADHLRRRTSITGEQAARGRPPRHRPDVPEHPAVRQHDGRGERAGRASTIGSRAAGSERSCGRAVDQARGGRGPRSARRSCSTSSASGSARTRSPATCRMATSGGWRSRARSRPTRSCCCSTSRPPA